MRPKKKTMLKFEDVNKGSARWSVFSYQALPAGVPCSIVYELGRVWKASIAGAKRYKHAVRLGRCSGPVPTRYDLFTGRLFSSRLVLIDIW